MKRIPNYCQLPQNATLQEIAKTFLWARCYTDSNGYQIKCYKGDFYIYTGTHYERTSRESLRLEILGFIQEQKALSKRTTRSAVENVLINLAALTTVPDDKEVPCFLKTPGKSGSRFIAMKNGIFDLERYTRGKNPLTPHTSDFFSFGCLPFNYNPKADCPTWKKFINQILPDKEVNRFMQEWFGYCLVDSIEHQLFTLFIGNGANGKSVVCMVLRVLLGRDNISAVTLEQFSATRTFPLYEMVGKKANIVEEIGEVHKVAEDILKDIVSGAEKTIERKHEHPALVKFKVKLIFASNVVPRFRDRSEGLWRRVIFVPFTVQILDRKKQNKNFVDSTWWIKSGEMSGILNWALLGLKRLSTRDYFVEPAASKKMRDEYRDEANPAVQFLLDNYEISKSGNLCSDRLYSAYRRSIEKQNGTALGKPMFTREVQRAFPRAKLSKNARAIKNGSSGLSRSRVWENLRAKP